MPIVNQFRHALHGGLLASLLLLPSLTAQTLAWDHNPASKSGPFNWGVVSPSFGTCGSTQAPVGTKQTPIDIQPAKAVTATLPGLIFQYTATPFAVENTGHVVEVTYEAGSVLHIGKSVNDEYKLARFHFHAPSEHTIDGKQYDAELHLVHTNVLGENLVVAVLLNQSAPAPPGLYSDILAHAPPSVGKTPAAGKTLNAKDLLPRNSGYYTYAGSLTTPPCTEGVRWIVMAKPMDVPASVITQLHSAISAFPGYNGYPNNNRPVVPLNGRTVLRVP